MRYNALICAVSLCLMSIPLQAAEDNTLFLSLTRKARSLKDLPTSVSVVTQEQVQSSGAHNAGELLRNELGLTAGEYGGLGGTVNFMLRGSSAEEVLVLVDGRRINDPAMGLVNASMIPTNNIERIEIIRGGASAIYGTSAFGGVINIITKTPVSETPSLELSTSLSSFNTMDHRISFDVKREKLSAMANAGRVTTDGWRENSQFDNNSFFGRITYTDDTAGRFDLSGNVYRSNAGVPGQGVSLGQYDGEKERKASTPGAEQKENNAAARLEHTRSWGGLQLKTILSSAENKTDYTVPSWFLNETYTSHSYTGETQLSCGFGTTAGLVWNEEQYQSRDNTFSTVKTDRSRVGSAAYVQQEWKLWDILEVMPSVRYDASSAFDSVFSPRLTLLATLGRVKLSANTGSVWRAPTFNEQYWPLESSNYGTGTTYITTGNANLKPEEGITSDIGVEFSGRIVNTRLTGFLTTSTNLISWQSIYGTNAAGPTVTSIPMNINSARQAGVEFEFNHAIVSGLTHQIKFTYLKAENTDTNTALVYRPEIMGTYNITLLTGFGMTITPQVRYTGSQRTGNTWTPGLDELPAFTLLSCKVAQRFKLCDIWVSADNILDEKYQTRLYYPLPGQSFGAGITMRFWS